MQQFEKNFEKCKLCSSDQISLYYKDFNNITISICEDCGIQFMNPQYSLDYLKEFYSHYTPEGISADELKSRKAWEFNIELFTQYKPSKGRLLDIGCGNGRSLKMALDKGWKPDGYEIDEDLSNRVKNQTGVYVFSGDFTKIKWPQKHYDVVSMNHVIEHLKSPIEYLNTILTTLKDDGILFIAMPNIHSFSSKSKFILEKLKLKRSKIGRYYDTGHHLFYFTPDSINRFLSKNGYEVIETCNCTNSKITKSGFMEEIRRIMYNVFMWKSTFYIVARKKVLCGGP